MSMLIGRRFLQLRRLYAVGILTCFSLFGLVLAAHGQTDSISQLIDKFKVNDGTDHSDVMNALAKIGPSAVDPLIAALKDSNNKSVRQGAAGALSKIKDPRASEALIAVLKENPDDNDVIYALWTLKDPRAIEPLLVDLNKKKGSDAFGIVDLLNLRGTAGFLEDFKDPRVDSALLEALKQPQTAWNIIVIYGAYPFFIRRGEPGSEDILIAALNRFGDEFGDNFMNTDMATAFLSCGNLKLEQAARELAQRKGWTLTPITGKGSIHWGSSR